MLSCTCGKHTDFTSNGCTMDDEPAEGGFIRRHIHNTLAPCWSYTRTPDDDDPIVP